MWSDLWNDWPTIDDILRKEWERQMAALGRLVTEAEASE